MGLLKVLYADKRGINLRNFVAHGIAQVEGSTGSMRVSWFRVLCCSARSGLKRCTFRRMKRPKGVLRIWGEA